MEPTLTNSLWTSFNASVHRRISLCTSSPLFLRAFKSFSTGYMLATAVSGPDIRVPVGTSFPILSIRIFAHSRCSWKSLLFFSFTLSKSSWSISAKSFRTWSIIAGTASSGSLILLPRLFPTV